MTTCVTPVSLEVRPVVVRVESPVVQARVESRPIAVRPLPTVVKVVVHSTPTTVRIGGSGTSAADTDPDILRTISADRSVEADHTQLWADEMCIEDSIEVTAEDDGEALLL